MFAYYDILALSVPFSGIGYGYAFVINLERRRLVWLLFLVFWVGVFGFVFFLFCVRKTKPPFGVLHRKKGMGVP